MNKISLIATRVVINMAMFWLFVGSIAANSNKLTSISEDELKQRIETLYSPVDLRYTPEVHQIVDGYIKKYRSGSERLIGLSEQFFPMYEYVLSAQGIPSELKYLSVVESGLRQNIVSQAGAVGLWQFMRTTGKVYGLTINSTVDERRDILRSTEAASQYLKDLHAQFGDWTIALAAYNCGPSRMKRVIQSTAKDEFWALKASLPKETRRYIPKYVAISYMMSYWHTHGLEPVIDLSKSSIASARIYDYSKLKDIADLIDMDYDLVKELNPAFLKAYIPKNTKGYILTLPEAKMYEYLAINGSWENLIDSPHLSQSLKGRFLMSSSMKQMWQEIKPMEKITEINLVSPLNTSNDDLPKLPLSTLRSDEKGVVRTETVEKYHKLSAQQSLEDVAALYHVTIDDLLTLNTIDVQSPPIPGAMIRVE